MAKWLRAWLLCPVADVDGWWNAGEREAGEARDELDDASKVLLVKAAWAPSAVGPVAAVVVAAVLFCGSVVPVLAPLLAVIARA